MHGFSRKLKLGFFRVTFSFFCRFDISNRRTTTPSSEPVEKKAKTMPSTEIVTQPSSLPTLTYKLKPEHKRYSFKVLNESVGTTPMPPQDLMEGEATTLKQYKYSTDDYKDFEEVETVTPQVCSLKSLCVQKLFCRLLTCKLRLLFGE